MWGHDQGYDQPMMIYPSFMRKGKGGKGQEKGGGGPASMKGCWMYVKGDGGFGMDPYMGGKGCGYGKGCDYGKGCGYGKGGNKGSSEKRKTRSSATSVPATLDEDKIEEITAFLQAHGGTLPLGKLTTAFPGLKRVQVQEHWNVEAGADPSSSDYTVTTGPPSGVEVAEPRPKRTRRDADAPPPPDLDSDTIASITEYLQQRNGHANLGNLTTDFPGLKKAQLEAVFPIEGTQVYLHGYEVDFSAEQHSKSWHESPHMSKKKEKKAKRERGPDAPAPPPLGDGVAQEIREYLSEHGGSAPLGKLTSVFEGVKMKQLAEGGFGVTAATSNSDPIVSLA